MGQVLLRPASNDQEGPSTATGGIGSSDPPGTGSPPHAGPAASRRWAGLLLLCAAFGSGWLAAVTQSNRHQKETLSPESTVGLAEEPGVVVTVEPVTVQAVQRSVEAFGTLYGFEEVSLSARVEGRVRRILHDVSDQVEPSELLLEIDPTDYELAVQQADRALYVELARLGLKKVSDAPVDLSRVPFVAKAKSLMDHAKTRLDRINRLAASKNVSAEETDNAASDFRTAQAEYANQILEAETDLAMVKMKLVGLDVAREQLANTRVLVPTPSVAVPGVDDVKYIVSLRAVSEGSLVRPGTEILRVVIAQVLKLRVPVPERFSSEIELQQPVNVYVASASEPIRGTVTRIYPTVDSTTRTFQVEIEVPNQTGDLKPGSFAKAAILTRIDPTAVTVPLSSVVQFAGITKLFLVENGKAKEVPVTLGTQTTDWVEIVEPPLTPESLVVTSGQTGIADDTPVTIRDPLSVNTPPTDSH